MRLALAPVKAPCSCPKNSLSINSVGMALATTSFPVPVSPVIETLILLFIALFYLLKTFLIASLCPIIVFSKLKFCSSFSFSSSTLLSNSRFSLIFITKFQSKCLVWLFLTI
jgi:hypothetical protein